MIQSNRPQIFSITEEPEDPELNRRMALYERNAEWLSEHWTLLADEQYKGRWVAASEGEIFVADDRWEAKRLALEKHPHDVPYTQFVPKEKCMRIYTPRMLRDVSNR